MRMIGNTVGTVVYNWVADVRKNPMLLRSSLIPVFFVVNLLFVEKMEEQALEEELELDMNQNKVVTDRDFFERVTQSEFLKN